MDGFEELVWALGHSLWEAAVVGVGLWGVLRVVPPERVRVRYGLAVGALVMVVFGVWVTWRVMERPEVWRRGAEASAMVGNEKVKTQNSKLKMESGALKTVGNGVANGAGATGAGGRRVDWVEVLGVGWAVGVGVMLMRMGMGLSRVRGLVEVGREVEVAGLRELGTRMGLKGVRGLVSEVYKVPAVVGAWSPIILVPAALLAEMSPEQMRMILAHELAHVRRWDYVVNLVQQVVEALLFFNPAVWWISRQIRVEREACCDALAVAVVGDAPLMARTLADVAERMRLVREEALPMAALGVAGGGRRSLVVERVRRLMGAGQRVVFPWWTLALGLGVAAVVLVVIGSTAELTVRAAEAVLTPKERVEKMAALQKEVGNGSAGWVSEEMTKAQMSGVVRLEDGGVLPRGVNCTVYSRDNNTSTANALRLDGEGRFSQMVPGHTAIVAVQVPGYAAAVSKMIKVQEDGAFPPVELVVRKGFEGKMELRGADGKLVPEAEVEMRHWVSLQNGTSFGGFQSDLTNEGGVITVAHASELPAQVTIRAKGFQQESQEVTLKEGEVKKIVLSAARPATGTVVDVATGVGVAGAEIQLVRSTGGGMANPKSAYFKPGVAVTADEEGRFSIDGLRDDSPYDFWVTAKGHGGEIVRGVHAGETGLQWKLGPARAIQLEVKAEEGAMPKKVGVTNPLRFDNGSDYSGRELAVEEKGGVGVVTFEDPLPGTVEFTAGGKSVTAVVGKDRTVVLDLRREAEAVKGPQTREVVVKLDYPADGAEPQGKLRVDWMTREEPDSYTPKWVEVKGGEARVVVPVPTKFRYDQGGLVGYWVVEKSGIEVPEGTEPLVIHVAAEPAGAIVGKVLDEKGALFDKYFYASIETVKESPAVSDYRRPWMQGVNANDASGTFLFSAMPLGGTYRVVVTAGERMGMSEEVVVDGEKPIREVSVQFAAGVPVEGRVVGPKGEAMGNVEVELWRERTGHSYSTSVKTDGEGRFVFEHVDKKMGTYTVKVRPVHGMVGKEVKGIVVGGKALEIKLAAGLTAKGKVVDVETGTGIADTAVKLWAKVPGQAGYSGEIKAMTNVAGEFEAKGLEAIEYKVEVENTYDVGSKVIRDAGGKVTGVQMAGTPASALPTVMGGDSKVVEIKRMRSPWR
jgi:hypothetical protein